MSDDFTLDDVAAGQGNLGPVPPGVKVKGTRKRRSDAGQARVETGAGVPRRRAPRVEQKEVYELVGFPIIISDQVAQMASKFWRENSLTGTEIGELTVALGDEAMSHKSILKYLQGLSANAVHIRLAMVLTKLAVPRMAAAGMLPPELANAFTATASAATGSETQTESQRGDHSAVSNGTGGTRFDNGSNGVGQVNGSRSNPEPGTAESSDWQRVAPETVQADVTVETG